MLFDPNIGGGEKGSQLKTVASSDLSLQDPQDNLLETHVLNFFLDSLFVEQVSVYLLKNTKIHFPFIIL